MGPGGAGPVAKKKRRVPLIVKILVPILAIILILVGVVVLAVNIFQAEASADYYTIGNDRIPSVPFVLGEERKLTASSTVTDNGVTTKILTYALADVDQSADMIEYVTYLSANDGFLNLIDRDFSGPEGFGILGRNSVDEGKQITVTVQYNASGYVITIVKEEGEIIPNDPSEEPSDEPSDEPTAPADNAYREPMITPAPGWEYNDKEEFWVYEKNTAWFVYDVTDLTTSDVSDKTETYAMVAWLKRVGDDDYEYVSDIESTTVAGLPAWEFTFRNENYTARAIYIDYGNWMYEIGSFVPLSINNDQYAAEIQQMVDSFRLK
ncbi:MAG: hypothetical protein FWD55_05615 [Propionibacteriaceae bacterium]|nr:hypothetical protein [Propionibacteriaceae bacterium]